MEDKDWKIKIRKIRAQQEKDFLDSWNQNIMKELYSEILENISQTLWRFNIYLSKRLTPNRITHVGLMRSKKVTINKEEVTLEEHIYDRELLFGGSTHFVKSFYINKG